MVLKVTPFGDFGLQLKVEDKGHMKVKFVF